MNSPIDNLGTWVETRAAILFTRAVRVAFGLCLAMLTLSAASKAQSQSELRVKAAYVFNLTKYVEFSTPRDHLVIGIVGDGPMVETLRSELSGKISDSRPIIILVGPSDDELRKCDLLYVAGSSNKRIQLLLQHASTHKLLTVGDASSFADLGGVVGLVTVGERVEIRINLEASRKADLRISSRLLNLATVIGVAPERGR